MSATLPSPLAPFDRRLLSVIERVVPAVERAEWMRSWQAELWHMRHRRGNRRLNLSAGLVRDALWLRTDSWRSAYRGTALLCLATLLVMLLLSVSIAVILAGSWHSLTQFEAQFQRFLVEAPLVVFVSFATSSRRHQGGSSASRTLFRIRRQVFFAAKLALILLLVLFLSADLCQPLRTLWPTSADLLQSFLFVLFAVVGLRWAFRDQELRCKQCLRSLATPARVGRPSHNLLEWNGTELLCKDGHGLLSVPEMETSWCQSSAWIAQSSCWNQPISW